MIRKFLNLFRLPREKHEDLELRDVRERSRRQSALIQTFNSLAGEIQAERVKIEATHLAGGFSGRGEYDTMSELMEGAAHMVKFGKIEGMKASLALLKRAQVKFAQRRTLEGMDAKGFKQNYLGTWAKPDEREDKPRG